MRKSIYSLVTAFTLAIISVVLCGCSLSVDFGETSENERSAVTIVPETTVETENAATKNITETSTAEIETDAEITAESHVLLGSVVEIQPADGVSVAVELA